jgi:hypothetical protein
MKNTHRHTVRPSLAAHRRYVRVNVSWGRIRLCTREEADAYTARRTPEESAILEARIRESLEGPQVYLTADELMARIRTEGVRRAH